MDKAKAMQELATMEARRKQLEALLLQEQSPPQKSQSQLKGEQLLKETYGINAKVAEAMVANILQIAAAETQHVDVEMPPSMVAFQPMETSSNASLNVPRTVGATLGDRKSEVSVHPSDSISQVSRTSSGKCKTLTYKGAFADFTIPPELVLFKCCCKANCDDIGRGSISAHVKNIGHTGEMEKLTNKSKQERVAIMNDRGWFEIGNDEFQDERGIQMKFTQIKP